LNWLAKAEYEPDFDSVVEYIVLDRYFKSQMQDLKIYLRELGRLKTAEMISKAQNYIDAHDFKDNKSNHGHTETRDLSIRSSNRKQKRFEQLRRTRL